MRELLWNVAFLLASSQAALGQFQSQALKLPPELTATCNSHFQLLTPDGATEELAPLVIYLHGAGAKGDDNAKPITEPMPKLLASPEVQRKFPAFVLVPQCRSGEDRLGRPNNWVKWVGQKENPPADWKQSETEPSDQLRAAMVVLDDVLAKRPVDKRRIYLTGVSMGGSGSWWWAGHDPERFAAVVTCCGLSEIDAATRLKTLPVWAFHGSDDDVAPVDRTRRMIAALKAVDAPVQFTEYAGVGHNIAGRVLQDTKVLEWMFSQRRGDAR